MKIEVGEYVRTKNGLIFKVDKEKKWLQINEFQNLAGERDITKHSFNIIDLIEVGDYVNGHLVIGKAENNLETLYVCSDAHETIHNKDIKSIVTKEKFENIKYEVIK